MAGGAEEHRGAEAAEVEILPARLASVINTWHGLDRLGRRKLFSDTVHADCEPSLRQAGKAYPVGKILVEGSLRSASMSHSEGSTTEDDVATTHRQSLNSGRSSLSNPTTVHTGSAGRCAAVSQSSSVSEEDPSEEADDEPLSEERAAQLLADIRRERADRERVRFFLARHNFRGVAARRTTLLGYGFTCPLHRAVQACDKEMVQLLLQAGASPQQCDSGGRTPHDYAIYRNRSGSHSEILALLKEAEDTTSRSETV